MNSKISDNYIFDSVLDLSKSDSDVTPFLKSNLTYVVDQQAGNGTYTSSQIIIDSTSLASSGTVFNDYSEAYLAIPYNVKLTGTSNVVADLAAGSLNMHNYLTSLKNNSIIDSITVEQGGKTIINASSNLSQFVNFKMHSTFSQDNLNKMGATLQYYPDSVGNYTYTASNVQVRNVANNPNSTAFTTPESHNSGVLKRQQQLFPYTTAITTQAKQINEAGAVQAVNGSLVAGTSTFSDLHFIATIRLKDLLDYFAKTSALTRGIGYKITIRVNQGVSSFTHSVLPASATPFANLVIGTQSFTGIGGSTVQSSMLHVGPNTLANTLTYTAGTVIIAADSLKLTSQIDVGPNALLNGIRLYVPSYDVSPSFQEKLLSLPVLNRPFNDIYFNVVSNQLPGQAINVQLASGISSPKALIIVPQIAQNINSFNSNASAFDPSPACTAPQSSITNMQVKIGSQYVLFDRVNYGFVQFIQNNATMFGLNGNQSDMLGSGLIDYQKWNHNYRYYVYDLSRYSASQDGIPQMISIEALNNSALALDLYCYVLYERQASINLVSGSLEVE